MTRTAGQGVRYIMAGCVGSRAAKFCAIFCWRRVAGGRRSCGSPATHAPPARRCVDARLCKGHVYVCVCFLELQGGYAACGSASSALGALVPSIGRGPSGRAWL